MTYNPIRRLITRQSDHLERTINHMTSIPLKSHDIKTKYHAVKTYLNTGCSVLHVTLKYHISKNNSLFLCNFINDPTPNNVFQRLQWKR